MHCSRPELINLMKIWDAKGSLALFPCSEVSETETVGIFAVPKDEHFDRLILNPTVLNSRMTPYSNFTKKLAPGSLLALLHLEPSQAFRFAADDLSDFYYTFKVSARRARRNCIGTKIYPSELHGLSCVRPEHLKGPCYPALATLAMGDSHAVEIAQGSHYALLQMEAGCMLESETLEYRKPIPGAISSSFSALTITSGSKGFIVTNWLVNLQKGIPWFLKLLMLPIRRLVLCLIRASRNAMKLRAFYLEPILTASLVECQPPDLGFYFFVGSRPKFVVKALAPDNC